MVITKKPFECVQRLRVRASAPGNKKRLRRRRRQIRLLRTLCFAREERSNFTLVHNVNWVSRQRTGNKRDTGNR